MQLYEEISDNLSLQDISKKHGRTIKAIEMRIDFLIRKKYQENYTIDSLSKLFNKTEKEVSMVLQQNKELKKSENSSVIDRLNRIDEKIDTLEKILLKIYKKIKS